MFNFLINVVTILIASVAASSIFGGLPIIAAIMILDEFGKTLPWWAWPWWPMVWAFFIVLCIKEGMLFEELWKE